jgi:hypothetical protein
MNESQAIAHCASERLPAAGGGLPSASWALAMTEARRSRIIAYPSPGFATASTLLLASPVTVAVSTSDRTSATTAKKSAAHGGDSMTAPRLHGRMTSTTRPRDRDEPTERDARRLSGAFGSLGPHPTTPRTKWARPGAWFIRLLASSPRPMMDSPGTANIPLSSSKVIAKS